MSVFDRYLDGANKIDVAIARIQGFCSGKKAFVAFSGGKDSQCCYHLAKQAGVPFDAIYSITRFEPPELLDFIRDSYPDVRFRRAYRKSLVAEIADKGLPNRWARWCCESKHARAPGYDIAIIGVRAEESPRRAATWRAFGFKPDKSAYVCPVIDWTEKDVWEYIGHVGAPHCRLYDPPFNFRRIGCICCPMAPSKMAADAATWPKTAAMLKYGASLYVARMKSQGWITKRGRPCADWCRAADPLEEFWSRWINSGQTAKPLDAPVPDDEDAMCLFAGTGFSESDGAEEDE